MFVCLEIDWGCAYCLEMWAAKEAVKLGLSYREVSQDIFDERVLRNFGGTWPIINNTSNPIK